jgi:NAD(P)-dependent dehydrogenase (short-subunit alcohol dehydrogenase family)
VYLAARSEKRTAEVIKEIQKAHTTSSGELLFHPLQLDDLASIKSSAEQLLARESRLDVLWNNAGVMVPPQGSTTVQGYELQLGVNNLGHFLFTHFLHPLLAKTAASATKNSVRVVWVASSAADNAPIPAIDFSNMDYHHDEGIWSKYSRSKAGNVLHAVEYGRRAGSKGIISMVR